jgi:DNA primase
MPQIAKSTIQELSDKMDALAVVGDYVRLEKRSGRYMGLCPFHNEKTPSFSVNPDLKLYYCFGCGKGGTVLTFVMEMEKLSFKETVELLARRFGVPLIYEDAPGPQPDQEYAVRIEGITELYGRVAGSFHYWLMERPEGRAALQYIIARGISKEMIAKFRLGYAPADRRWLFHFLSGKGYSEAFLGSSMLFSSKYPQVSFFADRLMFPIANWQGKTVAFGGRLLSGEGPKYLNSSESDFYKKGQTLFAIDLALSAIRKTKEVYLAEGYMDVIALHQAGITNAVAPLGTAFTDEQARLLRRWAERVYLIFDADTPGQQATVKALLTCRRNSLACAVVVPGKGLETEKEGIFKDPADILQEAGPEVLQSSIKCSMLDFEYLMFHSRSLFDISSTEGKAKAISFLFPYLETLDSEVSRDVAIGQVADAFGVDRLAIRHDFNRSQGAGRHTEGLHKPPSIRMNDELYLLMVVLLHYRLLYPEFRTKIVIKEIEDSAAKDLFIAMEECFAHDESGMSDLLSRINSEELRNFVIQRSASKEFTVNPEQLVRDGIKKIKRKGLERQGKAILTQLRLKKDTAQGYGDSHNGIGLEELLAEKKQLDTELH